nr:unnamed protein product [Callosobruchus chinensis]
MTSVKLSENAYCKMIMHAVKYPHCSVNGLLLSKSSSSNPKDVEFVEAIPLFHINTNLIPMAEIALMQVDAYASKKGLVISGYYVAPENAKETSFDKIHNRILEKVAVNYRDPIAVIVNCTTRDVQMGKVYLKVASYADGNYKNFDQIVIPEKAINICANTLDNNFYKKIVDFDNHLDNISLDWSNSKLEEELENLV